MVPRAISHAGLPLHRFWRRKQVLFFPYSSAPGANHGVWSLPLRILLGRGFAFATVRNHLVDVFGHTSRIDCRE
jgi:hypothetical protein